ncbi:MAG: cation transporter, partial [SAR202 cluster bacterium]|nr:cation transporter [SAR202 cluster bacterium]
GVVAMGVSVAVNVATSWHLLRVARRTGSPALQATAWHRASDILTSLGVLAGLVVIMATPWKFLDAVVALAVAAIVVWTAFRLFGRAIRDLLDVSLPDVEEQGVRDALEAHVDGFVEYHSLRTRRSGTHRHIDFHLVMPRTLTVGEAHQITDRIEAEIERRLPRTITTIHVEPCETPQGVCDLECQPGAIPYCRRAPYHSHAERPAEPAAARTDTPG